MQPADFERILRRVVREELQGLLDRLPAPRLSPRQAELVALLGSVFGRESFTSRDLVDRVGVPVGARPQLRDALVALAGADLRPHKVGLVLRGIAEAGGKAGALRLVVSATAGGARVWGVEGG